MVEGPLVPVVPFFLWVLTLVSGWLLAYACPPHFCLTIEALSIKMLSPGRFVAVLGMFHTDTVPYSILGVGMQ
jgi:hypothetical protein